MADEAFKYPPGMKPAREWQRHGVGLVDVEAIQQDAVTAARRELQGLDVLAANNAAHKDKVCHCLFGEANRPPVYYYNGTRLCGYCERPIL